MHVYVRSQLGGIIYDGMVTQRFGLRQIDFTAVVIVLVICCGGVMAIKSADHLSAHPMAEAGKQIAGIVVGLAVMLCVGLSDYERILSRSMRPLYVVNLLLLAIVAVKGHASHGAARWISIGRFELQPSEFAKIILIATLSLYLYDHIDTVATWPTLLKSLAHIGIPMLLIAKQPDLGTSLVLLSIWFGVMTVAGARPQHLLVVLVAGVAAFAGMWQFNLLKDYQKNRLAVFINPNADPLDTGYHLHQSEIAIGSGQLMGEGYEHGQENNGNFIPEHQTDFIFTVIGEEGGFVACAILLGLYLILIERSVGILAGCEDPLGRMLCAGVVSMLTFHVVVNAGMTMGVMPVVGVPLPFFSYGLSSLIVNMAAVGLLMSVAGRRYRIMF